MPAKVIKNKGGSYRVVTPNAVHAKHTTKEKALAQQRLLNAVDHGWEATLKPTDRKRKFNLLGRKNG